MAKQLGEIKISGTIDNFVYYKKGNEYFVRAKPRPLGKKYHKDPAYAYLRKNNELFVKAVQNNKLLRDTLHPVLYRIKLAPVGKLTKLFRQYFGNADNDSRKQDLSLFEGYEFAEKQYFQQTVNTPIFSAMDRNTGQFKVSLPEISRLNMQVTPAATHFRLVLVITAIDPVNRLYKMEMAQTDDILITDESGAAISLSARVPELRGSMLFAALGIHFYQEQSGKNSPLSNTHNAALILQASL